MKKLKAFLHIYRKSLTSPKYYFELLKTPFIFSIKYLLVMALIASAIVSVSTSIQTTPQLKTTVNNTILKARELFPNDLVISLNNGSWTINKPEPYIVPVPIENIPKDTPKNLVVFYHDGTLDDLKKLDTIAIVNTTNLVIEDNGQIQTYPLRDFPNGSFTKRNFETLVDSFQAITKYLPFLAAATIFLGLFIYYFLYRIIYLLIVGALISLAGMLSSVRLGFKNAYVIGLHTMTLPLTVEVISDILRFQLPIPSWFLILNVAFSLIVLNVLKKKGPVPNIDEPKPV